MSAVLLPPVTLADADEDGTLRIRPVSTGTRFEVEHREDGSIVLTPMAYLEREGRWIPEREMWIHRDPEVLASLKRGVSQAERGETVPYDLGDLRSDDE